MGVAETVKVARERAGLTQTDLATKAGVSLSTIQKVEGGTTAPRRPTIRVVAEALGLTLEQLEGTVTIKLPKAVYDSIAERATAEGHESVPAFLEAVATSKVKRIKRRSGAAAGSKAGTHA